MINVLLHYPSREGTNMTHHAGHSEYVKDAEGQAKIPQTRPCLDVLFCPTPQTTLSYVNRITKVHTFTTAEILTGSQQL